MPSVYLDSHNNSTMFTTCCRVAINDDQSKCPQCKEEIAQQSHKDRWIHAYGKLRRGEHP